MATTTITNSCKLELLKAAHCTLVAQASLAGAGVNAAFTITGLTATTDVALGMAAGGTNVAAGAIVASIDSLTQVTVSKAHTGTVTTGTISFTADAFKISLIKGGTGGTASGTYDGTLSNAGTPNNSSGGTPSSTNIGTDEVAASGSYAAGGVALVNVSPILSSSTAVGTFGNVSITSATIATIAAVIYNTTVRLGQATYALAANRTVSIHDFGGAQSVTAGTLTLSMPTQNSSVGLLRIA
jgi:hypothetical protein